MSEPSIAFDFEDVALTVRGFPIGSLYGIVEVTIGDHYVPVLTITVYDQHDRHITLQSSDPFEQIISLNLQQEIRRRFKTHIEDAVETLLYELDIQHINDPGHRVMPKQRVLEDA